jgi:penicillin-insensitive murein endopeptidase
MHAVRAIGIVLALLSAPLWAQDAGTLAPVVLPPLENPADPALPAKQLFGRAATAAPLPAEAYGFYAKGCLAGAQALPVNGPFWQAMRLSRNRNWGHPDLVHFLKHFSQKAADVSGWPGLLIGDMSQPRGGPMLTGHSSHQVGLDADIWLLPMPKRELSRAEREQTSSLNVVRADRLDVDAKAWTDQHLAVIRTAAMEPAVQRVFVNPAIKKVMCRTQKGQWWMGKIRPTAGHNYHFHVRLHCPPGQAGCVAQDPVPPGDGCDAGLDWWFSEEALNPKPGGGPAKPPLRLADLPKQCEAVLGAK